MTLQNALGDLALDASVTAIGTTLDSILTELGSKLDGGGTVALDATTLAALETVSASVTNWPGDFPDAEVLAKLETIRLLLAAGIAITGTVTVQGSDGSSLHTLHTDSDGSVIIAGSAAVGGVVGDNPVPIGGVDASNHVQHLKVAADGSLYVTQPGVNDGTQKTQIVNAAGTVAAVNADGSIAVMDQTVQDLVHLLGVIASRLGTNDGLGKMLVNVGNATLAVTESGTWTVQPGNTPNTSAWLTQNPNVSTTLFGVQGAGLDQHYQSISAFTDAVRSKVTVS
jgi:hypothetical protein